MTETIAMTYTETTTGEVKTADVHPDEVENMKASGWIIAPDVEKQAPKKKKLNGVND